MHEVEIHILGVKCSCGYNADTFTQSNAVTLAYVHGGACTPSVVRDHRPQHLINA